MKLTIFLQIQKCHCVRCNMLSFQYCHFNDNLLMYRWIEHEDGSEDVAEDEDTPCGTLPPAKASMCTICGMCTLYMCVYNTCVRKCVQYKYTIHAYKMSNSSTVQGKHPQSSAPVLNIFGQHFISIFTSLCLFEEHSSQKLLNKFSWKLRICMILTHLTNAQPRNLYIS